MPINPFQTNAEMSWGGYNTQKANSGVVGGRLGGGMEKGNTGKNPNVAWTENQLKPSPKAPNAQPGATADMARADYRADAPPAAKEGRRRGAFGSGGGGRGGYSAGGDININLGDNAAVGRGNRAGIGNISGDNNDFSGNSGQIGGSNNRMTAPSRRGTRGAPTSPAGSPPAGTPAAPTPGGGKKRTPTPVGGAPTPKALPGGPAPAPAIGAGPKPKAIGPGTPETPTPATPTGTKDVRTRQQKIEDLANDPGATAGERSAAQGKLGETPKGPVGKMGGGTDAEQTSNFKGLQGAVSKSATAGGAKEPMNQRGQGSSGMPTAQSTSGGAMANLEKNKAKPSSPTTASAPATQTPSGPQASAPTGLRQRRPVTGFDKRTIEPAGTGKIGPRMNPDGTEDTRQYTVGGQRFMPAGEDPNYGGVQPAAVQPKRGTQESTTQAAEPSNPAQEKEKVKKAAKGAVKKAVNKAPTNPSTKKKGKAKSTKSSDEEKK